MKPRTVTTYKILAVAAAAAAGSTVALSTEAGSSPASTQRPAGSYRPLHDGDGYPLVGNLIRKGGHAPPHDAGSEGGRPAPDPDEG